MEEQRMEYMRVSPLSVRGLQATEHYLNAESGLGGVLLELVRLRASQWNGCHFCIGLHRHELRRRGESDERIEAVGRWRETDLFTERERAALRWTEALTDIRESEANDAEYEAVRVHFTEKELVDLTVAVASMNAWNRIAIAFRPQWDEARGARRGVAPATRDGGEMPELQMRQGVRAE